MVPDLEFDFPACSWCEDGGTMSHDGDGFYCVACQCNWSNDGRNGKRGYQ